MEQIINKAIDYLEVSLRFHHLMNTIDAGKDIAELEPEQLHASSEAIDHCDYYIQSAIEILESLMSKHTEL